MLAAVEEFTPSLLPFVHSAYSSVSKLFWEDVEVASAEGVQQGDPIGPLLFCITIHKMVSQLESAFNVWYLDNGTLGGMEQELVSALETIQREGEHMPSLLNSFQDLKIVGPSCATLLGSPLFVPLSQVHALSPRYTSWS